MNEPQQFQHKATGQIVTATRLPDENGYDWDVQGVAMLSGQMMDAKFTCNFEPIPSPAKPTRGAVKAAEAISDAIEAELGVVLWDDVTEDIAALIEKHMGVGDLVQASTKAAAMLEHCIHELSDVEGRGVPLTPEADVLRALDAALARHNGTATDKEGR